MPLASAADKAAITVSPASGRIVVERDYPIYRPETGDHGHTITKIIDWAPLPFQASHRLVSVHRHHQAIAQGPRLAKMADMTGVHDIETTIGHDNPLAALSG